MVASDPAESSTGLRVVSLVPSITEILRTWDHDPIACTEYCEQPDLRHVGGTKNPNIAQIVELAPDVVMVDVEENRREDAEALEAHGIELLVTDVTGLTDVEPTLDQIAARLGMARSADADDPAAVTRIEPEIRAFVPIWRRPWMTISGDTFGSSLLASLGVRTIFAESSVRYPEISLDQVRDERPDVILAPSEPYVFKADHLAELATIAPTIEVDGQDLFWWGTRTTAARRRLARALADSLA